MTSTGTFKHASASVRLNLMLKSAQIMNYPNATRAAAPLTTHVNYREGMHRLKQMSTTDILAI